MSEGCAAIKNMLLATTKTVEKWIAENEKSFQTPNWLCSEMSSLDKKDVELLKCMVCTRFKEKLMLMQNFRLAFIDGTPNIHALTFKDHVATAIHSY